VASPTASPTASPLPARTLGRAPRWWSGIHGGAVAALTAARAAWAKTSRRRRVAIGVLSAVVLVLAIVPFAARHDDLSTRALQAFHTHLRNARLVEATAALTEIERTGELSSEVVGRYKAELATAQGQLAAQERQKTEQEFRAGRFQAAVEAAGRAAALEPLDADTLFLQAEALRRASGLTEAADIYAALIARFPADPRVDDALYWLAEQRLAAGRRDDARAFYERIIADFPKSNFRKSARRRLR
jgi:TolA-binding protein